MVRKPGLAVPRITEFQLISPPFTQCLTQEPGRWALSPRTPASDKRVVGLGFQSANSLDVSLQKCLGAWLELLPGSCGSVGRSCSLSQVAQAKGLAHNPDPREGQLHSLGFLLPLLLLVNLKTRSKKGP